MLPPMLRSRTVWLLLTCAACGGGGGGGAPLGNPPRLLLNDVVVPPGATGAQLELGLAADSPPPTMVQVDLVTDPARIRLRPDVSAIAPLVDLDADLVEPGRLRLVFGDGSSRTGPATLPTGALVRIPFEVVAGAGPGVVEVRAEQQIGSDAVGDDADVDATPTVGRVTLQ